MFLVAPETEKPQLAARQSLPSATAEQPKLSPRQSSPLSSPRQPTITTNPNAEVQLSVQPVAAPRSFTSQQVSSKSAPPPVAPRPASRPHSSPGVSPRIQAEVSRSADVSANTDQSQTATKEQLHKQSPASSSSSSPVVSPRQKGFQSPRTPPAVAPKPKRTSNQKAETHVDDPSKPIEAELFVSINAANESSPDTGNRNMLPGSVNYDIVQGASKTNWTAGIVSSADLKKPEKKNDIKGNVDVVDVVADTNSPDSNVVNGTCSPHTKSEHLNDQDNIVETTEKPFNNVSEAVEKLSNIEKDLDTSQVDVSLLSNRSRTFSSSSNASSYTEFTECDVEGENIPEDIAEEEESEFHENSGIQKERNDKDEEYESDFEDGENDAAKKESEGNVDEPQNSVQTRDSGLDMNRLKTLAQNIVTDVISSIKKSDFDIEETKLDEATLKEHDLPTSQNQTEAPSLPESPPPSFDDHQNAEPQAPSLPESPPPLPNSEVPSDVATEVTVVDLALYPDSDQSSEGTTENRTEQREKEVSEVIDVVDISVSTTLHAAAPDASIKIQNINTDNDFENGKVEYVGNTMTVFTESLPTDNEIDTSVSQVIDDSKGQEDDINMEDNDEQSVSNVITMYSNLEKSLEEQNTQVYNSNIETNNNVVNKEVNLAEEQIESRDTNSLRSIINTVSDLDPCGKVDSNIENTYEEPLKELNNPVMDKVNGHADEVFVKSSKLTESLKDEAESPRLESLSPRLESLSPRLGSSSPRSDTESPRSEGKFTSRVDRILSQTEELEKGKCSPETDKMFRSKLFLVNSKIFQHELYKMMSYIGFLN